MQHIPGSNQIWANMRRLRDSIPAFGQIAALPARKLDGRDLALWKLVLKPTYGDFCKYGWSSLKGLDNTAFFFRLTRLESRDCRSYPPSTYSRWAWKGSKAWRGLVLWSPSPLKRLPTQDLIQAYPQVPAAKGNCLLTMSYSSRNHCWLSKLSNWRRIQSWNVAFARVLAWAFRRQCFT